MFSKENLIVSAERHSIPSATLNSHIQRAIKNKEITSLKRNYYVTKKYIDKNKSKVFYTYFIGNKLIEPSYISRESALAYYGLLAEANSTVITLTTVKTTRRFENKLGIFDYKNVKEELFRGYKVIEKEFIVYIAEPYKAIFDYLYYRVPLSEMKNKDKLLEYLEEFRIDIDEGKSGELEKLFEFIKTV